MFSRRCAHHTHKAAHWALAPFSAASAVLAHFASAQPPFHEEVEIGKSDAHPVSCAGGAFPTGRFPKNEFKGGTDDTSIPSDARARRRINGCRRGSTRYSAGDDRTRLRNPFGGRKC